MRKYAAIFRIQLLNSLAYPLEFLGRSVMVVMFLWIFFQLWRTVYAVNGSARLEGLSLGDTLWYFMLAESIELGRPRLAQNIAQAVKEGSIAYLLNKPFNFLLYQMSAGLGESAVRMGLTALFGSAVTWWMVGPPPSPLGWLPTLLLVLGAWMLHFCVNALIGLLAFVTEETTPFEWIYQKLTFVLGGLLIPLDFYPQWLQTAARALPFPAMLYGPARYFVQPEAAAFWRTAGMQLAWLLALGSILVLAYRGGVRRLVINGG